MENTSRRLLLSCGVLVLAICLCLSLVIIGGAGLFVWEQSSSVNPTTQIATPVQDQTPQPITTPQPSGGDIPPTTNALQPCKLLLQSTYCGFENNFI